MFSVQNSITTETPPIVDALPFVDTVIDEDEHQRVLAMRLVDDELEVFPPDRDYLEYLPDINVRIRSDTEDNDSRTTRWSANELSDIRVDTPPPELNNDDELKLWVQCLDQIKIKLEYRQRQLANLDLLKSYGSAAWKQFIVENERMEASMNKELEDLSNRIQEINTARKSGQEHVLRHLDVLQSHWDNLLVKNQMVAEEIVKIKNQLLSHSGSQENND